LSSITGVALSVSGPRGVDERENTRLAAMGLQQAEIRYEKSPAAHRSDDKTPATPKRAAGRHAREGRKPSAVVSRLREACHDRLFARVRRGAWPAASMTPLIDEIAVWGSRRCRTTRRNQVDRLRSRLMPEQLFAQELLNSFSCLFCKTLRVLNGVSVGNIDRRDP
jgi:hypothetical protein